MKTLTKTTIALIILALISVGAYLLLTHFKRISLNQPATPTTSSTPSSVSTSTPPQITTPTIPPPTPVAGPDKNSTAYLLANMHETFDDEFNSFSQYVDANDNITCNPGGTGTWETVYDFCSRTNSANDEAEIYIDPQFLSYLKTTNPTETTTAVDPFSVNNGILTIAAQPSDAIIQSAVGSWAKYTSGMITTQFSFSQEYGYFEMRAKLPTGPGIWPAFWLLPTDKSWPPEVDALEAFGSPNADGEGGPTEIHYASHAISVSNSCGNWHNVKVDITKDFHTYGVDIESTGITYYFDGEAYATCPANPDTNKPFYMLINLAVGGAGSWPGSPTASNTWPANMYVDYVRAYQRN